MRPQEPGRRDPPPLRRVARAAFSLSTLRTDGEINRPGATTGRRDDTPVLVEPVSEIELHADA